MIRKPDERKVKLKTQEITKMSKVWKKSKHLAMVVKKMMMTIT